MSRTLTAATETESKAQVMRPVLFAELDFASGPVRVHTGVGDLLHDGNTYLGVGSLGAITPIEEASDLAAHGVTLTLSGLDPSLVSIALSESYQGRSAELWIGFLDASYQLVADPAGPFKYRMDTMEITIGATAEISLSAESRNAIWNRANNRLWTDQDHQADHSGDLFFDHVSSVADAAITWPHHAGAGAGAATSRPPVPSTSNAQDEGGFVDGPSFDSDDR